MKSATLLIGLLASTITIALSIGLFEPFPIVKIDRYLLERTSSSEPVTNLQLLEQYYDEINSVPSKVRSNKKLLEFLKTFIALKPIIDEKDGQLLCNVDGYKLIRLALIVVRENRKSIKHLPKVLDEMRKFHAENCRSKFYTMFEEQIAPLMNSDAKIYDLFEEIIEKKVSGDGQGLGPNEEEPVNALDVIFIKEDLNKILDNEEVLDMFFKCRRVIPSYSGFEDMFEKCLIKPCEPYVKRLDTVFGMTEQVSLQPDCDISCPKENTQNFFGHWARYRLCKAALKKGSRQLAREAEFLTQNFVAGLRRL